MSKNKPKKPSLSEGLYFVPLGGSEQFGVNLNVYLCDGDMIAVDCGIGFAGENHPGIEILLPDPCFIEENIDSLKALIITHAHEDHVGAVPYLWDRFECPIYTTPFTAEVLDKKLDEARLKNVPIHVCDPMQTIEVGKFKIQFLPVSHSIPDTAALLIETPRGNILHSGDWNLDPHPSAGSVTDPAIFKAAGDKTILAYVGDSTNAEVPGRTGSESTVGPGLENVIRSCKGKVAVTIFSSNIGRIRSIALAARACGRQVGIVGRSLHNMVGAAQRCGYLEGVPEFIVEDEFDDFPSGEILLIVTGSQGEPRSALAKIARGEFNGVKLQRGDAVVFSSRPIPGNETEINTVRNNLLAGGVRVITPSDTEHTIHVSGHPCREEITDMLGWVRPQAVIPVHGERVQLEAQAELARSQGIRNVIVPNNGSVIRLAPGGCEIIDHVETGLLAVEEKRIIPADHSSISERRKLQYSGVVHVSLVIDKKGGLMGKPKIDAVGLLDESEKQILKNLETEISELLEDMDWEERVNEHFMAEELRIGIRRYFVHMLGIKPKATVHILRV